MQPDRQPGLADVDTAHAEFDALLRLVPPDAWTHRTPCDEWNIGQLVDHVTGAAHIYAALLDGLSFEESMNKGIADESSPVDRLADYREAVHGLNAALSSPEALTRTCEVAGATVSGFGLLVVRVFDVTVHCWDLSQALGRPAVLPDSIVGHAWTYAVHHYGAGPTGPSAATATVEDLVELTGRTVSTNGGGL